MDDYEIQIWTTRDPDKSMEENEAMGALVTAERMNHMEAGIKKKAAKGEKGDQGEPGADGAQGPKGDTGATVSLIILGVDDDGKLSAATGQLSNGEMFEVQIGKMG